VDRPLTEPRHWRRNVHRLVSVAVEGAPVTGRIQAVDADGVTLQLDSGPRQLPWSALGAGKVQVEFSRAGDGDAGIDSEDG
jgi:ribosome maturation factor RimP